VIIANIAVAHHRMTLTTPMRTMAKCIFPYRLPKTLEWKNLSSFSMGTGVVMRNMSAYSFDSFGRGSGGRSGGGMISTQWPITKANTIFNIVPQGFVHVVERFGKLHAMQQSGWFLAIPIVDQISYVIDLRERAMVRESFFIHCFINENLLFCPYHLVSV
jgi:hypothetical protein